jgi:multidrug efflux pump subunit AcrA (membrane-fusion protein)
VPPAFASTLTRGSEITLVVDDVNKEVILQVTGIAPVIDSVSQLVTLRARLKQPDPKILPGMTGVLRVKPE